MNDEERDALLAAFIAKTITPADRERLLRELRSDPRFARSARDLWAIDQVVSLELDTRARKAFVEQVSERLAAEPLPGPELLSDGAEATTEPEPDPAP